MKVYCAAQKKVVVNPENMGYASSRHLARPEKSKATHYGGFSRLQPRTEVVMQPAHQPTKAEQRDRMRELAEQRQRQTPERHDPNWVTLYWLARRVS